MDRPDTDHQRLTKKSFVQTRLLNKHFKFNDEMFRGSATITRIDFNEYNHLTYIHIKWDGTLLYDGHNYMDINTYLGLGATLTGVEDNLKIKISRILQYINVYPDEIFLFY